MAVISRALSESERVAGPRSVAVETLYIQSLNPVWLRPLPWFLAFMPRRLHRTARRACVPRQ